MNALLLPLLVLLALPHPSGASDGAASQAPADRAAGPAEGAEVIRIRIPGTAVDVELVPIPAAEGAPALWVARTETTWDQYDVFVYGLDQPDAGSGADAAARPSKPYVPPDRGFGHSGFPAMGMTLEAAKAYCAWLSERTGRRFRLPSESEWERLALAGSDAPYACDGPADCVDALAWHAGNADGQTRGVATKAPNAWGLHDVHGNVAEWVLTDDGGKPLAKGGSYKDGAERLATTFDLRQTSAWNASDPQIPKSKWWLADCSFVGFRVVMEAD